MPNDSKTYILNDQATEIDALDFTPYVETLADIIQTGNTPLTIGVFGPWGSGKTSLMKMVKNQLPLATLQPNGSHPTISSAESDRFFRLAFPFAGFTKYRGLCRYLPIPVKNNCISFARGGGKWGSRITASRHH